MEFFFFLICFWIWIFPNPCELFNFFLRFEFWVKLQYMAPWFFPSNLFKKANQKLNPNYKQKETKPKIQKKKTKTKRKIWIKNQSRNGNKQKTQIQNSGLFFFALFSRNHILRFSRIFFSKFLKMNEILQIFYVFLYKIAYHNKKNDSTSATIRKKISYVLYGTFFSLLITFGHSDYTKLIFIKYSIRLIVNWFLLLWKGFQILIKFHFCPGIHR